MAGIGTLRGENYTGFDKIDLIHGRLRIAGFAKSRTSYSPQSGKLGEKCLKLNL